MRQKMISNEINLLRDTFQRLIRRKANTNLGKLIDKTHPAVKYLYESVQCAIVHIFTKHGE